MPGADFQFRTARYPYGSTVEHFVQIEVDDDAADPTAIQVYQLDPTGAQQGPFLATRRAKGLYAYTRTYLGSPPASVVGDWETMWVSTGVAAGTTTRRHNIKSTNFNIS